MNLSNTFYDLKTQKNTYYAQKKSVPKKVEDAAQIYPFSLFDC